MLQATGVGEVGEILERELVRVGETLRELVKLVTKGP